ncbi:penicillin acylase family protein [Pararhizobium haloflavum]|uniref:penicillin acylase family protein n=1 Tax=Pararhizobium haloflavum TaxID=2037914 RepID=UPI0013000DBA|nr:penicillin acylase family protein [Pararhizobium haloflavum]
MKRLLKGLVLFIFAVVPLLAVFAGLGLLWMSRSLPPAAGTVQLDGLDGPVTIARDRQGVPHIQGESRDDVFAALGFAHAQDRLWQMEVARMAGKGRLSEMFGDATIGTDVWLRTIAIYDAARRSYETFPDEAKRALEAYAAGVNRWLAREPRAFSSALPPEFVVLGHEPEPWRPEDSVVVVKMMSVGLAANIADEVNRLAFARKGLSPDEIDDLLPLLPDETKVPPLPDLNALLDLNPAAQQAHLDAAAWGDISRVGLTGSGASNNWVVSGERTDTGLPILANDPHLGLSAPSVWYLAHLRVENGETAKNLVGATLAGAPLVLLGRNDAVAWGFTNTGTDVQDLFIEAVDPEDASRYRTPDGWQAFGEAEERIRVDGAEDHVFTRRWTRHGPVMPASYRNLGALLPDDKVAALRWTALADDDRTMLSGLALWDFASVADFQDGMRDFVTPMQSIVLADTEGAIGLIAPGRVPVRDPDNAVMGRAPVPGWEARYDWQGFIPYGDLPTARNPEVGAIGTANTRMVPRSYEPFLTLDWDEAYRQARVDERVIEADQPHGMETSRAVQADTYSGGFAELMPLMLDAIRDRDGVDRFVVSLMSDWDFEMQRDAAEPLIAMAWLREAMYAIFVDDLGDAFEPWLEARGQVLARILTGRSARDWCDVADTSQVEDCAAVLSSALETALGTLEARYGDDRNDWRWGDAHVALSVHQPFGQVWPLDRIFNVSVESGGGPFTLDRGRTDLGDEDAPFANRHAASFRAIYDLSDLDNSTFVITTGQSGNVFSSNYSNLAQPWSAVEGIEIPSDPSLYERDVDSVWQMVP